MILAITLGMFLAFAHVPSFIAWRLLIQRHTTREVRGRVTRVLSQVFVWDAFGV